MEIRKWGKKTSDSGGDREGNLKRKGQEKQFK